MVPSLDDDARRPAARGGVEQLGLLDDDARRGTQ
jgi:hypothetical protein